MSFLILILPPPSQGVSLFYYTYYLNHHRSNVRFVTETVKKSGNYQGSNLIYNNINNTISQDYVISNYDNPKHYNVTMETGFDQWPDGMDWTKERYLLNGAHHGQALSDYIHGHEKRADIIIDNNNTSKVIKSGNWISDTSHFGYLGTNYLYATTQSPASITFNATIDTAGTYEVFTRWVSDSNFATNARASLNFSGRTSNYVLDMSTRGGTWVPLDTMHLNVGEQVRLTISNLNANQTVVADGLRISKVIKCAALGIKVPEKVPFDFNIYPNPAKNQFAIQLSSNDKLEFVKIYDLLGRLILTSKEEIINTSFMPAGLFIVEVKTNQGQGVKKIGIQ